MWFWLALTFAFLVSIISLISKIILRKADEYVVAWVSAWIGLPVLLLIILKFFQIPQVDSVFWLATLCSSSLNVIAGIFLYRAMKLTDLSLIAPISAFNPVFTTLVSFFTLGETPSLRGALGVGIIVLGAYLLQFKALREGFLAPFKRLFSHKGVVLFLISNLIWAITPTFEKTAIFHTKPEVPSFVSLIGGIFLSLGFLPIMLKKSKAPLVQFRAHLKLFVIIGALGGIASFAGFTAFSLTNLGYATAIFKLSMVFTTVWGYLFLKEPGIKERFLGAAVMFGGVILLVS